MLFLLLALDASALDIEVSSVVRRGWPVGAVVSCEPGRQVYVAAGLPGETCPPAAIGGPCWDIGPAKLVAREDCPDTGTLLVQPRIPPSIRRFRIQAGEVGFDLSPPYDIEVLADHDGDFVVSDVRSLDALSRIAAVDGTVVFAAGDYPEVVELPWLVGGSVRIERPLSLSLPRIDHLPVLDIDGVVGDVEVDVPGWLFDGAVLQITDITGSTTVRADALVAVDRLEVRGATGAVDLVLPSALEIRDLTVADTSGTLSLDAGVLRRIGSNEGDRGGLFLTDNLGLTRLDLPSLLRISGGVVERNAALESLALGSWPSIGAAGDREGSLRIADNPLLSALPLDGLELWIQLQLTGNPLLPTCELEALLDGAVADCSGNLADACAEVGPCAAPVDFSEPGAAPTVTVTLERAADHARVPLTCSVDATDPEGLPLSVAITWTVDGVPWDGEPTTTIWPGDTVPPGVTRNGETWSCEAIASDGSSESAPAADSVTLEAPGGNVLLVVIDDVGLDKVSGYGAHPTPSITPVMDSLMDEGVTFHTAYAHPSCSPARAALMTGRHVRRSGVGSGIALNDDPWELPLEEETLPELLATAPDDWDNALIGKWHLSSALMPGFAEHPLTQGFHWFEGANSNLDRVVDPDAFLAEHGSRGGYYLWERNTNGALDVSRTYATTEQVDVALEQVGVLAEPWLLVLSMSAAHLPWEVAPDALHDYADVEDSSPVDLRMDSMVTALDMELGRLFDGIPADVLARTTSIVVGDNGTARQVIRPPWDATRAKLTLHEAGVRVPFIVNGPLVTTPGVSSSAMVHVVDVFPTLADIAGIDLGARELDGVSILGNIADPLAPSPRDYLYTERMVPNGAPPWDLYDGQTLRDDRHKVIVEPDRTHLYTLTPGVLDEGPDRIFQGMPTEGDRLTLEQLLTVLGAQVEALPFEY